MFFDQPSYCSPLWYIQNTGMDQFSLLKIGLGIYDGLWTNISADSYWSATSQIALANAIPFESGNRGTVIHSFSFQICRVRFNVKIVSVSQWIVGNPLNIAASPSKSVDIWTHSSSPSKAWQDILRQYWRLLLHWQNLLHICKAVLIILIGVQHSIF